MKILPVLLALSALAGCNDNKPSYSAQPGETAQLTGRALDPAGTPAPGVWVYARAEGADVSETRVTETDAEGLFRVQQAPVGDLIVVLNDGFGGGMVTSAVTVDGGNTDLGDLTVVDLEDYPQIVDIKGVGFEERVTRGEGDFQVFAYTSDRASAFAIRPTAVANRWDILRIDTASGAITVLSPDEPLYPADWPIIGLTGDAWITFGRVIEGDDPDASWVVMNLDGDEVHLGRTNLVIEPWPQWRALDSGELAVVETKPNATGLDLWVTQAGSEPDFHRLEDVSSVQLQHIAGSELLLTASAVCAVAPCGDSTVVGIDLTTRSLRQVGALPPTIWAQAAATDNRTIYAVLDNPWDLESVGLEAVDLSTGQRRVLATLATPGRGSVNLIVSPEGDRLAVWTVAIGDGDDHVWELQVDTGELNPIAPSRTFEGRDVSFCSEGTYCGVTYSPSGDLRLMISLPGESSDPDDDALALVDIGPDGGESVLLLEFPFADQLSLIESEESGRRLVVAPEEHPGFWQVFEVGSGAEPRQRTFLADSHVSLAFAPLGDRVFYTTRDPISEQVQLFTLDLANLPP